jgi:hypothetical protein
MGHLAQFVACADDYGQENSDANGYSSPRGGAGGTYSPLLKPLSPPLTDTEIVQLEHQVQQASFRVAKLREDMQIKLKDELSSKLAECRPTAHDPESPMLVIDGTSEEDLANGAVHYNNNNTREEAVAAAIAAAQADLPPGLTPQELQDKLAMAATKLPSLRARLEEANSRLQRVASEVSDDLRRNTILPPNTVERTLLGKTTPKAVPMMSMVKNGDNNGKNREGGDYEGEGVPQPDPAVLRALESGQIATGRGNSRRRTTGGGKIQLASTAVTPVPYNIPFDDEEEEKVPGGQ